MVNRAFIRVFVNSFMIDRLFFISPSRYPSVTFDIDHYCSLQNKFIYAQSEYRQYAKRSEYVKSY